MWRATTWAEVEALLGESETPSLDFKRKLGTSEDIAKQIAAMTVNGGVLLYGVDEDKETRVANELAPLSLGGAEERIHLIAASRISPVPDLEVVVIPSDGDPTLGVLAVAVPASSLAPHQANDRFPRRRGTTTDYMDEAEVERLYRQRHELSGAPPEPGSLIGRDFASTLDGYQLGEGTGLVQVVVKPAAGDVSHPAGAWQATALKGAVERAIDRQQPRFANSSLVKSFAAFSNWTATDVNGWAATNAAAIGSVSPQMAGQMLLGARLSYPATLSFQALLGLRMHMGVPGMREYLAAQEGEIVYELVAMLAIAGEYLGEVLGGGHLIAELALNGFADARSSFATSTSSTADLDAPTLPAAPNGLLASARTSAIELRQRPEDVARLLIERWLPSFYLDERDLFHVVVPGDSGAVA